MTISTRQENCLLVRLRGKLYSKALRGLLPMFMLMSSFGLPQPMILVGTQASIDKNDFRQSKRVGTSDLVGVHADANSVVSEPFPLKSVNAFTRETVGTRAFDLANLTTGLNWAGESDALWRKTVARDPSTVATLRTVAANTSVFLPAIVQDDGCPFPVIPPISELIPASGRNGNKFSVKTTAACTWKIQFRGDRTFIKNIVIVDAPPSLDGKVTGPFDVKYDVGINGGLERNDIIEIVEDGNTRTTHRVFQDGIACTFTVSPLSRPFTIEADDGDFDVETNDPGCEWAAVNNNPEFITITSGGGTRNGNGKVTYSVKANTGNERTGTITVRDKTHTITQDGVPPPQPGCTFTVSPPSRPFPAQGGNSDLAVETNAPGCEWAAENNNPEFITITSGGGTRSGNGTVDYSVAANTGSASRTGTITVQDKTHTITQAGTPPPPPGCTFTVSPPAPAGPFSPSVGTGSFDVTTTPPTGCPWTAESNNPEFITITSGGSGNGNGTVNYSVAANTGNASRTGTITVRDKTHTITQLASGGVPGCTYVVSPLRAFVGETKGSFGFTVTTTPQTGCPWTPLSNNPEFVTLISGTRNGSGTAIYSVEANAAEGASPRPGAIAVEGETHRIIQAAPGACETLEEKPPPEPIVIGQTIYGTLSTGTIRDCRSSRGTARLADRYEFTLTEARRVAINVASADFDPFIILLRKIGETEVKIDDDGAGFSSSRLPPVRPAREEFTLREAGTYIVEVTTFTTDGDGNYAVLIASEEAPLVPAILAAIIDGKTLIVIGENFAEGAKLFIGDSTKEENETTNDSSRSRTALIALKSAKKVNKELRKPKNQGAITLRVRNPNGKESDVFVVFRSSP